MKYLAIILTYLSLTGVALAAPRLEVNFDPDPLFSASDLIPGDEVSGIVTVVNNSETSQQVIAEAINIDDPDNFGQIINLRINTSGLGPIFNDSLADFFQAGELTLAPLATGESRTFNFTARFLPTADNQWQAVTTVFDLCVGFWGEAGMNCGDTVIGGGQEVDTASTGVQPGNSGSSGPRITGTGSNGGQRLIISQEQAQSVSIPASTILITWQTNLLATSQVVYGLTAGGPYILDLTAPNFGYPVATAADSLKTLNHAVVFGGLLPGATYSYRVVSRASPPTISFERQFTVPNSVEGMSLARSTQSDWSSGSNESDSEPGSGASGGGVMMLEGSTTSDSSPANSLNRGNLASALFAVSQNWTEFFEQPRFWLLFSLLIVLLFLAHRRQSGRNQAHPSIDN